MKRYHIIVEGSVQGVGFRAHCSTLARYFGLTGSVRNMSNGMVEIYIQGEKDGILQFLDGMKEENRFISISDYTLKEVPVVEGERRFTADYWYGWD